MLSALVVPGAGQWYLQRRSLAAVMFVVYLVALIVALQPVMSASASLAEQIQSGERQINAVLVTEMHAIVSSELRAPSPATLIVLGTWLLSIAHAWFATRR